jgi:hypothetical protein
VGEVSRVGCDRVFEEWVHLKVEDLRRRIGRTRLRNVISYSALRVAIGNGVGRRAVELNLVHAKEANCGRSR